VSRIALVLGSNGPEALGRLKQLEFAESDAMRLATALGAPDIEFSVVAPRGRSLSAILSEFQQHAAALGADDELLFYFAGHGIVRRGDFFLVLDGTELRQLPGTALPWDDVRRMIRHSDARSKVVVLDCCHAGEAISNDLGTLRGGFDEGAITEAFRGSTASILMACGPDGYAREVPAIDGGVLTTLIVRAIGPMRAQAVGVEGRLSLSRLRDWMWREIETREELAGARADKPLLLDSGGPTFYLNRAAMLQPSVLWRTRVGRQLWKNTPFPAGVEVFVGSAGILWNQPDPDDGIYCLAADSGAIKWSAPTPADANYVLLAENIVVTGCDDGTVVARAAATGSALWSRDLASGIVGGPILLPQLPGGISIGRSMRDRVERREMVPVLFLTFAGILCVLDLATGTEMTRLDLGSPTVANPLVWLEEPDARVVVAGWHGNLMFVRYASAESRLYFERSTPLDYANHHRVTGRATAELGATPVFHQGMIILGFARETYFDDPPLIALNAENGEIVWRASDPEGKAGGFGNLRSVPIVRGDEVIFAAAYTGKLGALGLDNGKLRWTLDLGREIFEQWSSPVVVGQSLYLARSDGYLHKVNIRERRREWSLFLGEQPDVERFVPANLPPPEMAAPAAWSVAKNAPITATPAVDQRCLYVGSFDGFLYCVGDPGDNAKQG
jgi:outer membrane protein assembly factor BamB